MIIRDICPQCQSLKYKKNGHIHNGKQNYQCKNCGRQFVDCFEQYLVSDDTRALIERLLVERTNLANISWVFVTFGDSGSQKQNCHQRREVGCQLLRGVVQARTRTVHHPSGESHVRI
jgi:transposase-like protein